MRATPLIGGDSTFEVSKELSMDSHSSVAEAQGSLGSQIHNPDNVAFTSESSGVFISSTLELSREASAGCVARYTRNCPITGSAPVFTFARPESLMMGRANSQKKTRSICLPHPASSPEEIMDAWRRRSAPTRPRTRKRLAARSAQLVASLKPLVSASTARAV